MVVPSPKAKVQSTNEGTVEVNDDKLFVMGPIEGHVCSIFQNIVVRVSHNDNVAMSRRSFGAQCLKRVFGMCRIAGECGLVDISSCPYFPDN